jgi:dienelactone hydrolase
MRKLLLLPQLAFFLAFVSGADGWTPQEKDLSVMAPQEPGPKITPLLRYHLQRAWEQDEARRDRIRTIRTEAELRALQGQLRSRLLENIGGLPGQKTPLNARLVGSLSFPGYRVEKVIFESVPRFYVPALVWVPEGQGPFPAVLVPCGHSTNGKIHYQYICQRLARRGYLAISWDPVGQGERSQFWDEAAGQSRYNLVCGEHAILGNLAYLAGANLARWETWDGIRALDYLLSRPDVDSARISITGTSGGGFQAAYLAALDDRISVAAPSCYISNLPMRMANRIFEDPDSDPEQDVYRMVADGIDHTGLLLMIYPRPVIVAAAVLDFFPIEGTRQAFSQVSEVYRRLGRADRIAMTEGYHRHQFSPANLAAVFRFLDRFNQMDPSRELESHEPIDQKMLMCTSRGQVSLEYRDARALVDLVAEHFQERRLTTRATLPELYRQSGGPDISRWTIDESPEGMPATLGWEARGSTEGPGLKLERYLLHHEGLGKPLIRVKGTDSRKGALIWLNLRGKLRVDDWPKVEELVRSGYEVISFDCRGTGEDRMPFRTKVDPPPPGTDPEAEYADVLNSVLANYVYNSLLIGRPYFFELIDDVAIVSRFAREVLGVSDLTVLGQGDAAFLAASATACLPGLSLFPAQPVSGFSWSGVLEKRTEVWPIHYLVPGGGYVR